jgi:hypothetical protein
VDRLDELTRRAEVVVLVDNPLDRSAGLPLLPGASVEAVIEGRAIDSVVQVPRRAVYDGSTVWVVSPDGILEKRTLEPVWRDDASLFVTGGLQTGDALVVSPLSAPVEGTRVQASREAR